MRHTAKEQSVFKHCSYCREGTAHTEIGKPCEDHVVTGCDAATGVTGAVLCDGAGSCTYAREGSAAVAEAVLPILIGMFDRFYEMPEEHAAENLLEEARAAVRRKAGELECSVQSLACTMLCAALAPDGRYLFFHVGDGLIAAWDPKDGCRVLSQYHHAIALNFTTFVTIPDTEYNFGRGSGGIGAFLLTSDGPEHHLSQNGELSERAELLLQAGCLFCEERMLRELNDITDQFQSEGMYDDASYAVLGNKHCAGDLFRKLEPDLRSLLFFVPEHAPHRVIDQLGSVFEILADHGGCLSEKAMTRALRTHSDSRTRLKLENLLAAGIIARENGNYYF